MIKSEVEQIGKWHLDKRVNISHILATILLAGSLFGYANSMTQTLTEHKKDIENLRERMDRQDRQLASDMQDIKSTLKDIQVYLRNNK